MLKKELEQELKVTKNLLTQMTFASKNVRINKKDIEFSKLNYSFSNNQLTSTEIEEIAEDTVVKTNIRELYNDVMQYEKVWNDEEVRDNVKEFTDELFDETSPFYIDFETFARQVVTECIKYGRVDFYQRWNIRDRVIQSLDPLSRQYITMYEYTPAVYNDGRNTLVLQNEPSSAPQVLTIITNNDADNRNGKTYFNRQMLNYVRFKKRLIMLQDLAADKAAIPAVLAMMSDDVQQGFNMQDTSTDSADGQVAFFAMIDTVSEQMSGLSSGNGVALAGVKDAKALTTNINPVMYQTFKAIADEELAMAIVGTAKTTQQTNKGSYSSDEVGYKVVTSEKQKWARIVQRNINKVIADSVHVHFNSFEEVAPDFKFDMKPKADNQEKLMWFNAGAKIKKSDAPEYLYTEDDKEEFIQKEQAQSLPFTEKKKIMKPKITLY